jgi:hypothetical protein
MASIPVLAYFEFESQLQHLSPMSESCTPRKSFVGAWGRWTTERTDALDQKYVAKETARAMPAWNDTCDVSGWPSWA